MVVGDFLSRNLWLVGIEKLKKYTQEMEDRSRREPSLLIVFLYHVPALYLRSVLFSK